MITKSQRRALSCRARKFFTDDEWNCTHDRWQARWSLSTNGDNNYILCRITSLYIAKRNMQTEQGITLLRLYPPVRLYAWWSNTGKGSKLSTDCCCATTTEDLYMWEGQAEWRRKYNYFEQFNKPNIYVLNCDLQGQRFVTINPVVSHSMAARLRKLLKIANVNNYYKRVNYITMLLTIAQERTVQLQQ